MTATRVTVSDVVAKVKKELVQLKSEIESIKQQKIQNKESFYSDPFVEIEAVQSLAKLDLMLSRLDTDPREASAETLSIFSNFLKNRFNTLKDTDALHLINLKSDINQACRLLEKELANTLGVQLSEYYTMVDREVDLTSLATGYGVTNQGGYGGEGQSRTALVDFIFTSIRTRAQLIDCVFQYVLPEEWCDFINLIPEAHFLRVMLGFELESERSRLQRIHSASSMGFINALSDRVFEVLGKQVAELSSMSTQNFRGALAREEISLDSFPDDKARILGVCFFALYEKWRERSGEYKSILSFYGASLVGDKNCKKRKLDASRAAIDMLANHGEIDFAKHFSSTGNLDLLPSLQSGVLGSVATLIAKWRTDIRDAVYLKSVASAQPRIGYVGNPR